MSSPWLLVRILLLLGIANGMPIFAKLILRNHLAAPLDGGLRFIDGRALFGSGKTIRGIVVAVVSAALASPLLGFDWIVGAGLAAASMLGDLLSSFVKRRLGLVAHSRATGLDQIPESLLPLLLLHKSLKVTAIDIVAVVVLFFVLEVILSRVFFRLHLRDRPY